MNLSDVLNLKTILAAIFVVSIYNKSFFVLLIGIRNGIEHVTERLCKNRKKNGISEEI